MVGRLASASGHRPGLWHRGRRRSLGQARALEDRRHPRRGPGRALQARPPRSTRPSPTRGYATYQARQVAARETRKTKRHTPSKSSCPDGGANSRAGFPPRAARSRHRPGRAGVPAQPPAGSLKSGAGRHRRRGARARRGALGSQGVLPPGRDRRRHPPPLRPAPAELDKVSHRVLRDPEAIALVGCPTGFASGRIRRRACSPRSGHRARGRKGHGNTDRRGQGWPPSVASQCGRSPKARAPGVTPSPPARGGGR